jgi:hypothetical protein
VDGVAGNDITVSIVNSGATWLANNPTRTTLDGVAGLQMGVSNMNSLTNTVTVTITFTGTYATSGVYASFSLVDVDQSLPQFTDRTSLTAQDASGAAMPLTATNNAPAKNTITGSGTTNPVAVGNANATDTTGNVNVSTITGSAVTSITFVWNNPTWTASSGAQAVLLGGTGALMLSSGLLAFRRRRSARQAA